MYEIFSLIRSTYRIKTDEPDLREDQEYILNEITELAKRECPDAVVIAGDIYDKAVPSAEAVEIFDQFLEKLTESVPDAVIMMISGNLTARQEWTASARCFPDRKST